jgi:hypothetical protein
MGLYVAILQHAEKPRWRARLWAYCHYDPSIWKNTQKPKSSQALDTARKGCFCSPIGRGEAVLENQDLVGRETTWAE